MPPYSCIIAQRAAPPGSFRRKERQRREVEDVRTLRGISLRERRRLADDLAARLLAELAQRLHRAARTDDIVEQQHLAAAKTFDVRPIETERLLAPVVIETSLTQSGCSM